MNVGKIFEKQFTKYFPSECLVYKIPDSTASFDKSSLSFSVKNPFDYIVWDSGRRRLMALELKSVKDSYISFERTKEDEGKKVIHFHQIEGLSKWDKFGVEAGFVIEFRAIETTIYINIKDFNNLIDRLEKISFNFKDLEKFNVPYIVVKQELLRTNYKYYIEDFLNELDDRSGFPHC